MEIEMLTEASTEHIEEIMAFLENINLALSDIYNVLRIIVTFVFVFVIFIVCRFAYKFFIQFFI